VRGIVVGFLSGSVMQDGACGYFTHGSSGLFAWDMTSKGTGSRRSRPAGLGLSSAASRAVGLLGLARAKLVDGQTSKI